MINKNIVFIGAVVFLAVIIFVIVITQRPTTTPTIKKEGLSVESPDLKVTPKTTAKEPLPTTIPSPTPKKYLKKINSITIESQDTLTPTPVKPTPTIIPTPKVTVAIDFFTEGK